MFQSLEVAFLSAAVKFVKINFVFLSNGYYHCVIRRIRNYVYCRHLGGVFLKMDDSAILEELVAVLEQNGVCVRREAMGGCGGGLC